MIDGLRMVFRYADAEIGRKALWQKARARYRRRKVRSSAAGSP